MHLQKGTKLYVRVDYKTGEKGMTRQDMQDHLDYVRQAAKERYFIGGGFANADGGMCIFEAESLAEAEKSVRNDPIIERGLYRFELFEWNLMVLSEDIMD